MDTEKIQNPAAGSVSRFWMLPYLAISASLLGLLSWLVHSFLLPEIPLWGHFLAILAALSILTLTLYALSRAGVAGGESDKSKEPD